MKKEYTVKDPVGLHARPASVLVQKASTYKNEIFIEFNDKLITLKSIIAVMSLGIPFNSNFKIVVEGENQGSVLNEIEEVMKKEGLI